MDSAKQSDAAGPSSSALGAPDWHAFEEFYRENFAALCRFVVSLGASEEDAADVVQDALLQVARRWSEVKSPMAYAIAVVRNSWVRLAMPRREAAWSPELDELPAEATDHSARMSLISAVSDLPSRQRDIVLLRATGFQLHEIAEFLGLSQSTVRVHLHRARRQLAPMIDSNATDET